MVTKKEIEKFFEPKKLAIVGVSRNKKKFGYLVFRDLKARGYEVCPVNPNTDKINGDLCYKSVKDLPADIIQETQFVFINNVDEVFEQGLLDFTPSSYPLEKLFAEEIEKAKNNKKRDRKKSTTKIAAKSKRKKRQSK